MWNFLRRFPVVAVMLAGSAGPAWSQNADVTRDEFANPLAVPVTTSPPSAARPTARPLPPAPNTPGLTIQQKFTNLKMGEFYRVVPKTRTVVEYITVQLSEDERSETAELNKVVETLKSNSPQEEKDAAAKALSGILEKQFTRDLERREKEVSELEDRVKKLRDQVTKRKEAKADIIKLRLTTIMNEAAGLGFPSSGEQGPQELGGDVLRFPTAPTYSSSPYPIPAYSAPAVPEGRFEQPVR